MVPRFLTLDQYAACHVHNGWPAISEIDFGWRWGRVGDLVAQRAPDECDAECVRAANSLYDEADRTGSVALGDHIFFEQWQMERLRDDGRLLEFVMVEPPVRPVR
jgi:hypothetical protein